MNYLIGCDDAMGAWVNAKAGNRWVPGSGVAFGVADDQGIACGATFTEYNGSNVFVSIAFERFTGARWLLFAIGQYGFNQLKCPRLTLVTESSNIKAVRFQERLGAVREATLTGAGRNGTDILISRLTPDSYMWRKLNGKQRRQRSDAPELRGTDPAATGLECPDVQHNAGLVAGQLEHSVRCADLASAD